MFALRANQPAKAFEETTGKTIALLLCSPLWQESADLALFASLEHEFPTKSLIEQAWQQNKNVFLPKVIGKREMIFVKINEWRELRKGNFSIMEPIDDREAVLKENTLMLVPGLAFDKNGWRLGYGAGYYDAYLAKTKLKKSVGICQDWQILNEIPHESHDIAVNFLFSESGLACVQN